MPVKPPSFRPSYLPPAPERAKAYERERGSARKRGYDANWDKAAKLFKDEHPLCLGCTAVGRVEPATIVDHIEPHQGDQAKFWDRSNWQPSCASHHSVVKQRLETLYAKGHATLAELRLDSPKAIEITRDLLR